MIRYISLGLCVWNMEILRAYWKYFVGSIPSCVGVCCTLTTYLFISVLTWHLGHRPQRNISPLFIWKKNWKWFLLLLSGHSSFNNLFVFCLRMSPQKAHRTGVCRSGMRLLILSSMQPVQKHSGCAWKRFIHDGNNF